MNRIIISDTSCLIALNQIGQLNILHKTFTEIHITQIVAEEFQESLPGWIIVDDILDFNRFEQLKSILDPGEASAITLALETENAILIIDEKKGRKVAADLNLIIMGTLKVLLIAKNKGVLSSVKQVIFELQNHSFRFNKAILDEVLKLAGES